MQVPLARLPPGQQRRLSLAPLQIIIARSCSACGSTAIYTCMPVYCTAHHGAARRILALCHCAIVPLCHCATPGAGILNAHTRQASRYPTTCWPCRHGASDNQILYAPRDRCCPHLQLCKAWSSRRSACRAVAGWPAPCLRVGGHDEGACPYASTMPDTL